MATLCQYNDEKMTARGGFDLEKDLADYDGRTRRWHLRRSQKGRLDAVKWLIEVAQVPFERDMQRWNGTYINGRISDMTTKR